MKVFGFQRVLLAAILFSVPVANANDELIPPATLIVDAAEPQESVVVAAADPVAEAAAEVAAEPAAEPEVPVPSKGEIAKLPEKEIPVFTGAKQERRAEGGNLARLMITLGILTAVVGGAYFALRRWANRKGGDTKSPKIKILTQHSLGPKKSLAIINVAGESILIGITDHNISMLKTLSLIDDEVPESVPTTFGKAMAAFDDDDDYDALGPADRDEFAMRGLDEIRDRVSRQFEVR